jgi:hypothetical protein
LLLAGDAQILWGLDSAVSPCADWDGDGVDTIGVYRNGTFYLHNSNDSGPVQMTFSLGVPGDVGISGDWNDDGIDTIGVYRNGQFMLRNSNTIGFAEIVFALGISGDMPIAGNWDGLP